MLNGHQPMDVDDVLGEPSVRLTRTGAIFSDECSFEAWERIGRKLAYVQGAVMFWIGDFVNYGERKWGERYSQALDATDYEYQTLQNAAYVSRAVDISRRRENLPFSQHAEVASLEPDEQEAWLDTAEQEALSVRELRHRIGSQKFIEDIPPLPAGQYSTIVADPPWQYDNRATRAAAVRHYPTLSIEELLDLRVEGIHISEKAADNAHLYLWTTNAFLRDGFDILERWGFQFKTCLTWVKGRDGAPQLGIGNYFRSCTEHVLFGVRGKMPVKQSNQANWFECKRGKHSQKPDIFYDLVEAASPGPYLELFARVEPLLPRRAGWTPWGNEAQ
jgi:N6-adenosine-specific RNA methylase IME4